MLKLMSARPLPPLAASEVGAPRKTPAIGVMVATGLQLPDRPVNVRARTRTSYSTPLLTGPVRAEGGEASGSIDIGYQVLPPLSR